MQVGRYYVHMAAPCVADFPKNANTAGNCG